MRTSSHLSFPSLSVLVLSLSLTMSSAAKSYNRKLSVVGSDFFERFNWETKDDPTHGRVNYLSLEEARAKNLAYATEGKFFMFPDTTNTVDPDSRGRDSNRISSKEAFDDSVVILDLEHMPHGCATWPAFWTNTRDGPWPTGGEIDIIEGVNGAKQNLISLHSLPGCTMPKERHQTGTTVSTNCDTEVNNNQGCGTQVLSQSSYGQGFNKLRGGFYALARSREYGIKVWFWQRGDSHTPPDVRSNKKTVNPGLWGTPTAYFPTEGNCAYEKYFEAHRIIFDLTFCGDWAGSNSAWEASGCSPMSCNDFVDQNPDLFADAYWEINSLRVYTPVVV